MKVLVIAPQPFYQERGTPIAVDLLVKTLSKHNHEIDLLVYDIGDDRVYKNVNIHKVGTFPAIKSIKPGFSFKKIYFDFFLLVRLIRLLIKNKYDVIHAVEESVFMAFILGPIFRVPYIDDVDSCMTTQLVDKFPFLNIFSKLLHKIEVLPMRFATAVVPMCELFAKDARNVGAKRVVVLKDVSLIEEGVECDEDIRAEFNIQGKICMYIGNLESYQGLDFLLASFELVIKKLPDAKLVIIGGEDEDIEKYKNITKQLFFDGNVLFMGKRPVSLIGAYMKQADLLVSPRIHGVNTPMKIYSYIDSGTAVLATDRLTHNQVLTSSISCLSDVSEEAFSNNMVLLLNNDALRNELAVNAKKYVRSEHSYESYENTLTDLYNDIESELSQK